jgi:signal transduction histidine kinase
MRANDRALDLEIRDDGAGFDVAAARARAAAGESQGLLGMQERVALAGGTLLIHSAPGRGTSVRVRLPLSGGRREPAAHPAR